MKYSVHYYDSFSHEGFCLAEDMDLDTAKAFADKKRRENPSDMTLYEVFDENNVRVYQVGKY